MNPRVAAGIEWDDPTRGKNDGSVETADGEVHRYFTTAPGQGSFMKLPLMLKGHGIVAALLDKYEGGTLDEVGGAGSVQTASGRELEVEFVGEAHIRGKQLLERNRNVSLKEAMVSFVEGDSRLAKLAPNIQDLDLRENLLHSWADVASLGEQLSRLSVLNIAGNLMDPLAAGAASVLAGKFASLRVLVLSNTALTWRDAAAAARQMPTLEEMHVCGNGISSLSEVDEPSNDVGAAARAADEAELNPAEDDGFEYTTGLESLKVINLSDNALSAWTEVWRLSRLPKLENLLLSDNRLTKLQYWPVGTAAAAAATGTASPEETAAGSGSGSGSGSGLGTGGDTASVVNVVPFASLSSLSVNHNAIAGWASVDCLAAFPSLTAIRFQHNPLTDGAGPTEMRMVVIARAAKLKTLNGSVVRDRERSDAEKAYLRRAGDAFAEQHADGKSALELFGAGAAVLAEASAGGSDGPTEAATAATSTSAAGAGAGADTGAPAVAVDADKPDAAAVAAVVAAHAKGLYDRDSDLGKAIVAEHPRYFDLLDMHGHVLVAVSAAAKGSTLGDSVIKVTLRSLAADSCLMDPVTRRLPLSMTVGNLKVMFNRLFKCDVALQRLSYHDKSDAFPSVLDDDMKSLSFFGAADGGSIVMEEVDRREIEREQAEKDAALKARMDEQLKKGDNLRRHEHAQVAAQQAGAKAAAGV